LLPLIIEYNLLFLSKFNQKWLFYLDYEKKRIENKEIVKLAEKLYKTDLKIISLKKYQKKNSNKDKKKIEIELKTYEPKKLKTNRTSKKLLTFY
jgi:hypothetical protein